MTDDHAPMSHVPPTSDRPTPLTLKFDSTLPFQQAAVAAVVDLFAGQPLAASTLATTVDAGPLNLTEFGSANRLVLDDDALLANLVRVQERNGIEPPATRLEGRDFGVEMETGTGKTYVYLRTAFELNRTYGFTKFVVVVPSVAVREGVLHSLATMREHFRALYAAPVESFVYDGRRPGQLGAFARATAMQVMVINIQAFQRDANVMYAEQDRLSGYRPIDLLRSTNPIVVIDEPQSSARGDASRAAIAHLNPLCTLRYSATYDDAPKVYRLGPVEAFDQGLVKGISVLGVTEDGPDLNTAFVRVHGARPAKRTATLEINVDKGVKDGRRRVAVKPGSDLAHLSNGRQEYATGYVVAEIGGPAGQEEVVFTGGLRVRVGTETGGVQDDAMRLQVYETVREHLDRELVLRPRGVKVLSLFFIDKVANYRVYPDTDSSPLRGGEGASPSSSPLPRSGDGSGARANPTLGKIGRWFEDAYRELTALPKYAGLPADPVHRVHDGYFSRDKRGVYRDSTEKGSKEDDGAYSLIMRDKERLLSLDEPLRFVFSHSALREGWDNPNVFQICTLNETRSLAKKRQEIGRGLRLPVDQSGERIRDERITRLTVVANESYASFAASLQTEYEQDLRVRFGVVPRNAFRDLTFPPLPGSGDAPNASSPLPGSGEGPAQGVRANTPIGLDASRAIWSHLQAEGYLDREGRVGAAFQPNRLDVRLDLPDAYRDLRPAVTDVLARYVFATRVQDARRRRDVRLNKEVLLDPEFQALWDRIGAKTRYRVSFDTEGLIDAVVTALRVLPPVQPLRFNLDRADVAPVAAGVATRDPRALHSPHAAVHRAYRVPDVLAYLQNETRLTRRTLAEILVRSGRAESLRVNPQAFIAQVAAALNGVLGKVVVDGIAYERLPGETWEMSRLETDAEDGLTGYLDRLHAVQAPAKTPYDHVAVDSTVERDFAAACDADDRVRFYVKLPSWFHVSTPVGAYNPDWALRLAGPGRLVLVRETKGSPDRDDLRGTERAKIDCAAKHFAALGVDYCLATTLRAALANA